MKLLADQNLERRVALALRSQGHDVTIGVVDYPGNLPDRAVLRLAYHEGRILLTKGPDFGGLVVRHREPHAGVIIFRMKAATGQRKPARLLLLLRDHSDELDQLITVTECVYYC
jgi:predicted nuclease of predicted toxin-antitoxin system